MAESKNPDSKQRHSAGKSGGNGSANGFKGLGLSDPVYRGIVRMGFRMPTPVQRKALPVVLTGADTVVMARTGSGKTVAFLVPLLEKLLSTPKGQHGNHVRGIILSPTRELSVQTLRVLHKMIGDMDIRAIGITGGEGVEKQFGQLASKPDVIVATPGRLAHHLSEIPDFQLSGCCMCILDEADRLLEMGFAAQIREIARTLPDNSQKLLFSATMPKILVEFTKSGFAVDPSVVRLDQEATVSAELRVAFVTCRSMDKDATLLHLMQHIQDDKSRHAESRTGLTLIFAATRHHVEFIATLLKLSGIDSTLIYGSLDQEARKANLAAFRSGRTPVLVVTDVAARGIDVPLIDHVIHYHFPPSPKLFVHRSGRAARAGRIGYCWGLVEPDEMPYMMDLHLFLGRRPSNALVSDDNSNEATELSYTLEEMTPEMVHYGAVPEAAITQEVENVQRIMNSELSGSMGAETLRSLTKVCNNAMKQYRRSRPEASREGVRRAKAILEGQKLESGQRISGGAIPPHPLLRGMADRVHGDRAKVGLGSSEDLKKREDFLRAMSNFRPKETVFEAFATGGGKDVGVLSHLDKGRTTSNKKHDSSAALGAMKNMRRQMRMARDKGSTLVVAGTACALEAQTDPDGAEVDFAEEEVGTETDLPTRETPASNTVAVQVVSKRRLSKAERKRLKKDPDAATNASTASSHSKPTKAMRGTDFRDQAFFIDNDLNSEEAQRARQVEAAMQPSSASTARGTMGNALRLEEAILDVVGDERDDLVKNQRLVRWDKAKRKYVQTTVGAELSGDSKTKRTRLENGQLAANGKRKLGDLYDKWQKKTNRSVGRTGVFDDADTSGPAPRHAKHAKHSRSKDKDEPRTVDKIKKDRDKKRDLTIKNMKKSDRRQLERRDRAGRGAPQQRGGKRGKRP